MSTNVFAGTRQEGKAIISLRQASTDLGMPYRTVRTLIVDHEIAFEVVGRTWVISSESFARLKVIATEHTRKLKNLKLAQTKQRKPRKATSVA